MSVSGESEKLVAVDLVGESLKGIVFAIGFDKGDGDRSKIPADCFVARNFWDGASRGGGGGGGARGDSDRSQRKKSHACSSTAAQTCTAVP